MTLSQSPRHHAEEKHPRLAGVGAQIYEYPGDEVLYAALHTHLVRVENVQLMHWTNTTRSPQKQKCSYTTQTKFASGAEFGASFDLKPSFEGVSIGGLSIGFKSMLSSETTDSETHEQELTVPANSDFYLYQRKYVFSTHATWVLDAWDQKWNVGSQGGYRIQEGFVTSEIWAQEYVTSATRLTGKASENFSGVTWRDQQADTTRQWENVTQRCKDTLKDLGIDGSQR